nr:Zinc finger CCCH type [Hymenolepis microstoma]
METSAEEGVSELSIDEIELRRRALESFRKSTSTIYSVNERAAPVLNDITHPIKSSPNVEERFIISVRTHPNASTSSSSDEECDFASLPSVTIGPHEVKSSIPFNVNAKHPHLTSKNFVGQMQISYCKTKPIKEGPLPKPGKFSSPRKTLSLSSLHKALLKHARRREELEGTLKDYEKHLLDKKRHSMMLQTAMIKLKKRMEALQKHYQECQKEIIQMSKEKKTITSQLQIAKKRQERLGTVIVQQSKKRKSRKSKPFSAGLSQIVDYCNNTFDVLKASFRINSPFFQYYNPLAISKKMLDEVEMSSGCNESTINSSNQPSGVDPDTPICPFYLNGNCSDITCIFQHPGESVTSTPKSLRSLVELEENDPHFTESQCPVCGFLFDSSEDGHLPVICMSVSDWHSVFSKCEDWTPFLNSPIRADSVVFLKHHLHAVLTFSDDIVISACDFLQNITYHSDLLYFALNYCGISSLTDRRRLLRECLFRLLHRVRDPSISSAIYCMNGLLSVVYHIARFEWEVCGTRYGVSLVESLLSADPDNQIGLPMVHPARWGIWFLRMIFAVSAYFPSSPTHCPFIEPSQLLSNQAIFESAAADMRLSCNNLSIFVSQCSEASIPLSSISPIISFCHLFVQFLAAKGDSQQGAMHCLNVLQNSKLLQISDNLLLPSAIHLAKNCLPEDRSHTYRLISEIADKLSMQTCFTYCLACSMADNGKWESCSDILANHLSSLFSFQLPDATSVYSAFRRILCASQHPPIKIRNIVYLWMCFGLFSMIHSFSTGLLPDFLNHVIARLENFQGYDSSLHCPLISLLMHLGLSLANLLPSSESYLDALNKLLFPAYLVNDADFCSHPTSWFLELLQFIRVDKFSSSKSPGSLFARIVEVYGFRCLKSLIIIEEAVNNESLEWLQSVCSIARLEKPADEEFWLLIASLGVKFHPKSADDGKGLVLYLNECLSEAVEALPLSSRIWRLYAVLVKTCGLGDCQMEMLRQRVARVSPDMVPVVEEVLSKKTTAQIFLLLDKTLVEPLAFADYNEWLTQFCSELAYVISIFSLPYLTLS